MAVLLRLFLHKKMVINITTLILIIATVFTVARFQAVGANSLEPSFITPDVCELDSQSQEFTWSSNDLSVESWVLKAGSYPGTEDYYAGPFLDVTERSHTVSGFPSDGSIAYVSLWYKLDGQSWQYVIKECQTIDLKVPEMIYPNPCELTSQSQEFVWSGEDTNVDRWIFMVGTTEAGWDLFFSGALNASQTSITVNNLPTDGSTAYTRLMYRVPGSNSWQSVLGECSAAEIDVPDDPYFTSHSVDACLFAGNSEFIQWNDNNSDVEQYWLYVGSNRGWADAFNSYSIGKDNSVVATGLPADGRMLHMRLWYRIAGAWGWQDQSCEAWTAPIPPGFTSHDPDNCQFDSSSQVLEWDNNELAGITQYWIYAGDSEGSANIFNSGLLNNMTSLSLDGLPTDGSDVYLRLWFIHEGRWGWTDQVCRSTGA